MTSLKFVTLPGGNNLNIYRGLCYIIFGAGDILFEGEIELDKNSQKKIITGSIKGKSNSGLEIKGIFKIK